MTVHRIALAPRSPTCGRGTWWRRRTAVGERAQHEDDALDYVSTSPSPARWAAETRRQRHLAGGKRALGDALIAGIAVDLNAVIVTRNGPDSQRRGIPILSY